MSDYENSVLIYIRKGEAKQRPLVVICNFTPVVHESYKVGLPYGGTWKEIANSDHTVYQGSGIVNEGKLKALKKEWHGRQHSLVMRIAPLAMMVLESVGVPPKSFYEKKKEVAPKKKKTNRAKKSEKK